MTEKSTLPFAICRIEKLKASTLITISEKHTACTKNKQNPNPNIANIELIPDANDKQLGDIVTAKIGDIKHRKDAVLCVGYFLGASPQFFRPDAPERAGYYQEDILKPWIDANLKWLQEKHGDNLVKATVHLDEATPHIVAYVVPIHDDPKRPGKKKLSYNADFGGSKYRLQELQDEYAQAMEPFGLRRGKRGNTAIHQDTNRYCTEASESESQRRQRYAEEINLLATDAWMEVGNNIANEDGYIIEFNKRSRTLTVKYGQDVLFTRRGKEITPTANLTEEHLNQWQISFLKKIDQEKADKEAAKLRAEKKRQELQNLTVIEC